MKTDYEKFLISYYQSGNNLVDDGILGPKTMSAIDADIGVLPSTPIAIDPVTNAMLNVIHSARSRVGAREDGTTNTSDVLRNWRESCGFPVDARGPWCAVFVSYILWLHDYDKTAPRPNRVELSRGAQAIVRNIAESDVGESMSIENPGPGFGVWKRGSQSWKGHVRIITSYDDRTDTLYYIAGNENNSVREGSMPNGTWRNGLIAMSTLT